MTWRERLQPGRFRDAAFLIEAHDTGLGRRTVLHEYPLRDRPFAEDLGRRAREYSVTCYVIGADYMTGRDALLAALEAEGPGTLVHPYLGALRVSVGEVKLRESTAEGGMARFTIAFVESGENTEPAAAVATGAAVEAAADEAVGAIEESFSQDFSVDGEPQWVADAASGVLTGALGAVGALDATVAALSTELQARLNDLMRAPRDLAERLTSLVGGLQSLDRLPERALLMLRGLFEHGAALLAVSPGTPSRARQAVNQAAVLALVQRAALVEAVRASSRLPFTSHDEAVALRDELAAQLDRHLEEAYDESYVALTDLKVAMVRDIAARGADLARVLTITPAATLPALVIAHQLYGDTASEADIVARNRVRHPGFVPGGVPLRVLTR